MNKKDKLELKRLLKRKQTIKRFAIYGIIGIAVFLTTATIVMLTEGYYFDLNGRQVIKNGLIFVDTAPQGATVTINGVEQKDRTESRFTLPEGKYDLTVSRGDYRTWSRSFSLGGSEVVNLNYVLLVPNNIPSANISELKPDLRLATQSPDRRWVITHAPSDKQTMNLFDLNKEQITPTPLAIPSAVLPDAELGTLKEVQWSTNNQHVLISGGATQNQYFVINRSDPAASAHLNKLFGLELNNVTLKDNKFDKFYAIDANRSLRELDSNSKTISAPKFERVIDYKSYGNDIFLLAQENEQTGATEVRLVSKDGALLVANLQKQTNDDISLDLAEYDGNWYVAFASKVDNIAKVYKNPFDLIKTSSPVLPKPLADLDMVNPAAVSFSANTRFIAIQAGANFVVFDNEYERTYRYEIDRPIESATKAEWIDGHRLLVQSGTNQFMFDYDGINTQDLGTAAALAPLMFDRDYERYFSFVAEPTDAPAKFIFKQNTLDLETL